MPSTRPAHGSGNCATAISTATISTARPQQHVRLRVHQHAQIWYGQYGRRRDKGFLASLELEPPGTATHAEIDGVFRRLLAAIGATDVTEIEPYD